MNKVIDNFDKIIEYVRNSSEYKKYWSCYDKVKDNKKINTLIDEVKNIQKDIVKNEYYGKSIDELEINLNKKFNELNSIPLYIDFINSQKELNEILSLIKIRIEDYFNDLKGGN